MAQLTDDCYALITETDLADLRKALLGLESVLRRIACHADRFDNQGQIFELALKAVEWAGVESTDNGLIARPGNLSDLT